MDVVCNMMAHLAIDGVFYPVYRNDKARRTFVMICGANINNERCVTYCSNMNDDWDINVSTR